MSFKYKILFLSQLFNSENLAETLKRPGMTLDVDLAKFYEKILRNEKFNPMQLVHEKSNSDFAVVKSVITSVL